MENDNAGKSTAEGTRETDNVVILEYTPNNVLDTTKYVVDNAEHVHIAQSKIPDFINTFELQKGSSWLKELPFDFASLNDEQKLMLPLVFNAISFSYWSEPYWSVDYKGIQHTRGSWSLMAAIFRSIEEGESLLDPAVLSQLNREKLSHMLRGNTEIPMLDERKEILSNVGKVLVEKYSGKFSNVVEEAKGDGLHLLDIMLTKFSPTFDDSYMYKGKEVHFNKRAQSLVESIHSLFEGKGYGDLKNIESFTALADYIIPNILRNAGVVEYSKELMSIIDNRQQIEKGSEYEVEIRASVVWAVEYMRRALLEKGISVSAKEINDYIWVNGNNEATPFHLTRTTAY